MNSSPKKAKVAAAGTYLAWATAQLEGVGIGTPRLDALVLLEDILNTNRAQILADPDLLMPPEALKRLNKLVGRRMLHEPLAYIRNRTEFYGRDFYVDNRVLEPRAESETMVELLKTVSIPSSGVIIDVGTGSGALAITAKLELPEAKIVGVDIDQDCLLVARRNAKSLCAQVEFIKSDLLTKLPSKQLLHATLLCNLPYIPDDFQINTAATHEPRLAIFGGNDGLDMYRRLFSSITVRNLRPAYVLTESLPPQHTVLKAVAEQNGFVLAGSEDFIQVFKMGTGNSDL